MTRDRTYQQGYWRDRAFRVVDTGGLVFDDDSEFLPEIREQANLALAEAAVAVVIADGQQGLTAADEAIAEWLRGQKVPVLLAVNKCESPEAGLAMAAEFWGLGLGEPYPVSAIHGAGTGDLLDKLIDYLPPPRSWRAKSRSRWRSSAAPTWANPACSTPCAARSGPS